jgi:hypothetical protein
MSNSYRIRTTPGVDKSIKVLIDQEFEYLEILSLKILQDQIYTRQCSDYGVVVGRISVNNGFGVPNAKVSVFIPVTDEDDANPIISEIYPYKTTTDQNADGYRYNLLPYYPSYNGHVPTGTFFDREDVILDPTLKEVYDKYYKFTTTTNDSGDYMIFGVPVGPQTIFVDIDLSDIGEFSLTPNDLIRMGVATEDSVNKNKFKSSNNLDSLPQIISFNRNIEIEPLWGEPEICVLGITRTDFDISKESNITISPTAIFMGSLFSSIDEVAIKTNCKPNKKLGELCSLTAGPGEIESIRQTIDFDLKGRPALEVFELQNGGQVIDGDGTWLIDLPMNLDYVITNEFGEQEISADPSSGIPTKGKYRFKVKWNQSTDLRDPIKRGYYLVPNIREYGWDDSSQSSPTNSLDVRRSYAFTINWDDYGDDTTTFGDGMIKDAIDCKDKFYEFKYNKVYTISNLVTQYRRGSNKRKYISIKNILDEQCESTNNKFPSNDSQKRTDIIYLLFIILNTLMYPVIVALLTIMHILSFIVVVVLQPFLFLLGGFLLYNSVLFGIATVGAFVPPGAPGIAFSLALQCIAFLAASVAVTVLAIKVNKIKKYFQNLKIPNLTYPDCEFCNCDEPSGQDTAFTVNTENAEGGGAPNAIPQNDKGTALLTPYYNSALYEPRATTGDLYPQPITQVISGMPIPLDGDIGNGVSTTCLCTSFELEKYTCNQITPYTTISEPDDENNDEDKVEIRGWRVFSTDLPLPERINLFNLKAKYFTTTIPNASFNSSISAANGGKGTNQIKVRFAKDLNASGTPLSSLPLGSSSHLDNVMVIVVQPDLGNLFVQGQLVTFQDATMSSDINLTGATINDYGTNAITGTSLLMSGTPMAVTVNWANPTGTGVGITASTIYNLTGNTIDLSGVLHKFPMDVEYFQVITGMTYSDYISKSSNSLVNSLKSRYLENTFYINRIKRYKGSCNCVDDDIYKPTDIFQNNSNQYIIFLVRGVDPNSTRTKCEYDLSKIFGYNSFNAPGLTIEGQYKLNIPIQGGPKNTQHSGNNTTVNPYSGQKLFYPSYQFLPSNMSGFTTTLTNYYSAVDNNNGAYNGTGYGTFINNNLGLSVGFVSPGYVDSQQSGTYNQYLIEWQNSYSQNSCTARAPTPYTNASNRRLYYNQENIEGGSFLTMYNVNIQDPGTGKCKKDQDAACGVTYYHSPRYGAGFTINPSPNIVMRSDRLPTSTFDYKPNPAVSSYRPLHANIGFEVYLIDDQGSAVGEAYSNGVSDSGTFEDGPQNSLSDSLNCKDLAPFECYDNTGGTVVVLPKTNECWTNKINGEFIMSKGCYVLVTVPLLSIIRDFRLIAEWRSRLAVNFAACRNVFSHIFTNNWVNGTLYAFPFKNETFFDNNQNPFSDYCKDTMYFDSTNNNFYYRSTRYSYTSKFIGFNRPSGANDGNEKNLMYPTTVLDLGPRDALIQEISLTDDYDGYIVDKLKSTTFNDVSELLNIFIINRLTSNSYIQNILTAGVQRFFNERENDMIDGDYAQMNSINSEFAVAPYEPSNYPNANQLYQSTAPDDNVFGVFFNSNLQQRDFITPKRTIYFGGGNTTSTDCAFGNIPVKSQEVPFYLWSINQNEDGVSYDTIFGSQTNEWYTKQISSNYFFSHEYQSLDRILSSSRYFRTTNQNQTDYFKGYIYSVDGSGNLTANVTTWDQNTSEPRAINVGAPFHFYFGLRKGKSAFDRFASAWIDYKIIE